MLIVSGSFKGANLRSTTFSYARRTLVDFNSAHLSIVDFSFANLKKTNFEGDLPWTGINFTQANLQQAYLLNDYFQSLDLSGALSIDNAYIDVTKILKNKNLLLNSPGLCNITNIFHSWEPDTDVETDDTIFLEQTQTECHFTLRENHNQTTLFQRVSIEKIWNPKLWPVSYAVLKVSITLGVSVQLTALTENYQEIGNSISMSKRCN